MGLGRGGGEKKFSLGEFFFFSFLLFSLFFLFLSFSFFPPSSIFRAVRQGVCLVKLPGSHGRKARRATRERAGRGVERGTYPEDDAVLHGRYPGVRLRAVVLRVGSLDKVWEPRVSGAGRSTG